MSPRFQHPVNAYSHHVMDQQDPTKSNDATSAQKTLILEQSAHCDWDWWNTFHGYFKHGVDQPGTTPHQAVETTLNEAITNMAQYQSKPNQYFYTFCEMAYLKRYVHENPNQVSVIKGLAQFLSLSSGGMTSADNLLSHGEAFIRNYLLGRQWAITELGITPSLQMWIPDDFGHDAQLPVVLQAMGFMGAGFWRVPADQPDLSCSQVQVPPSAPSSILNNSIGLDFIWQASDGSQVQAHWLSAGYCQGNGFSNSCAPGTNNSITWDTCAQGVIAGFVQQNLTPTNQPTPYLFVPVDCDFCEPYSNLPDIISDWNQCNQTGDNCPGTQPSNVVAQMASFDQFMKLVHEYTAPGNPNGAALKTCYSNPTDGDTLFLPNPYFSGCYGSRPELKLLHYATTRTLMQAEAMEIFLEYLAFINSSKWSEIAAGARTSLAEAWLKLVPSTHHDYITGTATDEVYGSAPPDGEQLYDLQQAFAAAGELSQQILQQVASAIPASTGVVTVAVFNSLGFARSGVAQMNAPGVAVVSSVLPNSQNYFPVQQTENTDGTPSLLFVFEDPATNAVVSGLGYATAYLGNHAATVKPVLSLIPQQSPPVSSYQLSNEFIIAIIGPDGLTELYDRINDPQQSNNLLGSGGFQIVFYKDNGNIYRFANELPCETEPVSKFCLDQKITLVSEPLAITENGPLRYTLTATASAVIGGDTFTFTTNYSLVYGEPFLRIAVTGAAPSKYSVMVKVPFPSDVAKLTYGTPYHWDARAPRNYLGWPTADTKDVEGMTFEPTHEFVIPMDADDNYLAAIYHASTPGWAIDSKGALLGCILRNTPGTQQAAWGTDSDSHTASLAIRVPGKPDTADQLLSPAVGCNPGGPLGEALQFNNPLVGSVVPATSSNELPSTMSIASTSDPTAVITAAKAGTVNETDLILRLYQPTNSPLEGVQINMDSPISKMYLGQTLNVAGQSALETPLDSTNLSLQATEASITLTAPFALTTLALSRD